MTANLSVARLCARALSRPTFTALARGEDPKHLFRFLRDTDLVSKSDTVGAVFEKAFSVLRTSYRSEYVYTTAITNRIVFGRHSPRTASLSIELPVGRSIIDVAVFNGTSTAYEVKTELDTPRRLVTQTSDYLQAFDHVYVVTHPLLAARYADACDHRVGILALDKRDSLRTVRAATNNVANIDSRTLFRMLRKCEYQTALESECGYPIDVPNGLFAAHCEKLFCGLSHEAAHRIFLGAMRARTTDSDASSFVSALPPHLRVLAYASSLSKPQREQLLRTVDVRLTLA